MARYRVALNREVLGIVEADDIHTDPRAEAFRRGIIKNRYDIPKTELWLIEESKRGREDED